MANFKLDIFKLLNLLNNPKSGDIYSSLNEDERKGFAPLVAMRWMSGTSDEKQIILINEFVNQYVFSLGKHPHLLMKLMQVASSKTSKKYYWLPLKLKKKNVEANEIVAKYYDMTLREVYELDPFPSNDEIIQMAYELGLQKEDIKNLEKEFKA